MFNFLRIVKLFVVQLSWYPFLGKKKNKLAPHDTWCPGGVFSSGMFLLQACCKHFKTFIQVTLAEVTFDTEICFLEQDLGNLSSPSIIASWFC